VELFNTCTFVAFIQLGFLSQVYHTPASTPFLSMLKKKDDDDHEGNGENSNQTFQFWNKSLQELFLLNLGNLVDIWVLK